MKKGIFLLFLTAFYLQVIAQNIPGFRMPVPGEESELLAKLEQSKPGIAQIDLLLELGLYYVRLPGEETVDLQRGLSYAYKARVLADRFNYRDGYNASLILNGTALLEAGNSDMGHKALDSAIANVNKEWQNKKLAELPERKLRLLMQLGDSYLPQFKCSEAEKYFLEAIALCKTNGFKDLHYIHDRLAVLYQIKNDYNSVMYYQLEAVKSMETTGDMVSAGWFYYRLGIVYRTLGQYQKAVEYYELAYSYYKKKPSGVFFELGAATADALAKIGRSKDGITQMLEKCAVYPPKCDLDRRYIDHALGKCYLELKQYDSAEVHFLNVIRYQRKDRPSGLPQIKIGLGQTYVGWGKYLKAKPYLDECLASGIFSMTSLSRLYFLLYKVDSATGNYVRAIDYLLKHKDVENEIYKEAQIRATGELQIKYETDKKDREIRIKAQDILLKQAELKSVNWLKDVTLGGILLLFIILGLLYNQYRIKQKNNREISSKNLTLEHLLEEKEWLLKEVHHRVKNNLHTIMSLLQSQSAYLKDDALKAVQHSQHRVYAMSLIHQKLYQNGNSTNINMMLYLPELLEYLRDSFDIKQQIQITTDIRDIHLDISKAIPVGLILNEAVTNAIKYAFPGDRHGVIAIGMERIADKRIRLSIADNGIGIPGNWNKMQRDSLGLRLMKGLSDDVRGDFSIDNTNGTRITVEFQEELFSFEPRKAGKKTGETIS
ncbi:MAG TPA: histidine kinase dimerization/phosphoacceptor domain -containing protein [Niastella sp.]